MEILKFNKHAFKFYKEKMLEAGFPVHRYTDKELKIFMSEFVQSVNSVPGFLTDPEREQIVAHRMISKLRDKKLNEILGL
jgi:hypothetical protein